MDDQDVPSRPPAAATRLKEQAAAIRERINADLDEHERTTPGIHRQDSEITILLMRVHNLLLSNLWVEAKQHGLTTAKHSTLLILFRSPGQRLSMSELSDELYVSRTNVTKLIDGLERQGLVERANHPADRRSTLISLTDRARSFLERTLQRHWDYLHFLYQDLPPAEKDALTAALYDLLASWQLGVETPGGQQAPPGRRRRPPHLTPDP